MPTPALPVAPLPDDVDRRARALAEAWDRIGPVCVRRGDGRSGVALAQDGRGPVVRVHPRGPGQSLRDALGGPDVETHADWRALAAAGWRLD